MRIVPDVVSTVVGSVVFRHCVVVGSRTTRITTSGQRLLTISLMAGGHITLPNFTPIGKTVAEK